MAGESHPFKGFVHEFLEVTAPPVKVSATPASLRTAAPKFGQHSEKVLLEHRYTWEDIQRFFQEKVIA